MQHKNLQHNYVTDIFKLLNHHGLVFITTQGLIALSVKQIYKSRLFCQMSIARPLLCSTYVYFRIDSISSMCLTWVAIVIFRTWRLGAWALKKTYKVARTPVLPVMCSLLRNINGNIYGNSHQSAVII